jgi:hypothetical protein
MNAATKAAYKELAVSAWGVVKAITFMLLLVASAVFAHTDEYARAAYLLCLALLIKE